MKAKWIAAVLVFILVGLYFLVIKNKEDSPVGIDGLESLQTATEVLGESRTQLSVRLNLTETNMKSLQNAVISYIGSNGEAPEDLKGLRQMNPAVAEVSDAWGTAIKYEKLSQDTFRLISAGKDKTFQTEDDVILEY